MRSPVAIASALLLAAPASAAGLTRAAPPGSPSGALGSARYSLVALNGRRNGVETFALRAAGATLIDPSLDVWRLRSDVARRLVPGLRSAGVLAAAGPDARLQTFTHITSGDPLIPSEWWIHDVGVDSIEPPGPGIPVAVLDTGLDTTHPEFANRPNITLLNAQNVFGREEIHGTAVSSVVGAPANAIGLVGIYPQSRLQEWDFGGATVSDVLRAFASISRRPRSVVNISGGFFCCGPLLGRAIDRVIATGSVVVAAVGNERESESPRAVPASLPHVLTVGATDERDRVTFFSSRSAALDLAAPGQNIPVAVPTYYDPSGFTSFAGTSFSSPLVAGATAWIWTARPQLTNGQILDVMRDSARDVGRRGWDRDTGFGVLDVPAALAAPTPPLDPAEPNEDIYMVKPGGLTARGQAPLTTTGRPRTRIVARMDFQEDPEDVYRVWIPPHGRVAVRLRPTANLNVAVWAPQTASVFERGALLRRDLLGFSQRPGKAQDTILLTPNRKRGGYGYLDVYMPRSVRRASYTLTVATSARR